MEKIKELDEFVWEEHKNFCQKHILEKIQSLIDQESDVKVIKDYEVIDQDAMKELTEAPPDQLETVSKKFSDRLGNSTAKSEIKKIFLGAYTIFTRISNETWGAYKYLQEIDVKICPYCNENFIYRLLENQSRTALDMPNITIRADLDHFLPKSQYPLLAVSLYNLVPSCKICNSSVKGSFEFDFKKNPINPYESSFSDKFQFVRKPQNEKDKVDVLLGYSMDFDFDLDPKVDSQEKKGIHYMLDFFGILERYNHQHKEYIQRQIRREVIYDEVLKERMSGYLESLDVSPEKLNQLELLEISKTALGKLLFDSLDEVHNYRGDDFFK